MGTTWNSNQNQKPEMIHLKNTSINPNAIAYIDWNVEALDDGHQIHFVNDNENLVCVLKDEEDKLILERFFGKTPKKVPPPQFSVD